MVTFITCIMLGYAGFNLFLWIAWLRLKSTRIIPLPDNPPVTIIIVVRNEAQTIACLLEDISMQTFPLHTLEVIVVDDHSTDNTVQIVRMMGQKVSYTLRLLHLSNYIQENLAGNYKKKAIEIAVSGARGELIICTDGDCQAGKNWLQTMVAFYQAYQPVFISGPVTFYKEKGFFQKLQTVEFASLIGSGAALLQSGIPAMCNGANLAFTKKAFVQVGGYANTANTATGDDVFLLQKMNTAYPGNVLFIKHTEAIIYTRAKENIVDFVQQRKRWASKWNLYTDRRVSLLAVFIFISNFSVLLALFLLLWGNYPLRMFLIQITIKFSVEFVFLTSVLLFFKKPDFVKFIIPLQWVYFLYVSFFGIITHKKGYQWKGRKTS